MMLTDRGVLLAGRVRLAAAVLAMLVAAGCRSNPDTLEDTTGVTFDWQCSDNGCDVLRGPDTPAPALCAGESVGWAYSLNRFVGICSGWRLDQSTGWGSVPSLCRLVACEDDGDCPIWDDWTYVCRRGLCQLNDGGDITRVDVIALCLEAKPRSTDCHVGPSDTSVHHARNLAEQSCEGTGGPCSVPTECRHP